MPLAILQCLIILASSLNQVLHCNYETDSKTAFTKSIQSLGIILLQTDHEFNICMPYETIASLNLLRFNIGTEVHSALTLSFGNSCKVTEDVKVSYLKTLACSSLFL